MRISREADYALRSVLEVCRHGRTSTAAIAETQSIPPSILGRVIASLARAGILGTQRGAGGGVWLAAEPESFTVCNVIEAIQGPLSLNACTPNGESCAEAGRCPIRPVCELAYRRSREALDTSFAAVLELDGRAPDARAAGSDRR